MYNRLWTLFPRQFEASIYSFNKAVGTVEYLNKKEVKFNP